MFDFRAWTLYMDHLNPLLSLSLSHSLFLLPLQAVKISHTNQLYCFTELWLYHSYVLVTWRGVFLLAFCFSLFFTWALESKGSSHVFLWIHSTLCWQNLQIAYCLVRKSSLAIAQNLAVSLEFHGFLDSLFVSDGRFSIVAEWRTAGP